MDTGIRVFIDFGLRVLQVWWRSYHVMDNFDQNTFVLHTIQQELAMGQKQGPGTWRCSQNWFLCHVDLGMAFGAPNSLAPNFWLVRPEAPRSPNTLHTRWS